ncbi:MAG: membrane associated rhomboid family serine protease [Halioglobus sp.]|jgi:membrane associated rhomboid family serine protease
MTYTLTPFSFGRGETPKPVKTLIIAIATVSIFSGFFNQLIINIFGIVGLQELLSLSWNGFQSYFIWQAFTYMFVNSAGGGISGFFFIQLLFNLLILWFIGSALVEELGKKSFLRLFFLSGICAGFSALMVMGLTTTPFHLAGCTSSIFALLIVWSMLFPEIEILLFLTFPAQAKWVIWGIIGIDILLNISSAHYVYLAAHLTGVACGYFYALLACNLQSPFPVTHGFDNWVNSFGDRLRQRRDETEQMTQQFYQNIKVFDFKTGEAVIEDDEFVDIMLSKISMYGEASLTWKERRRLGKISQKKSGSKVEPDDDYGDE